MPLGSAHKSRVATAIVLAALAAVCLWKGGLALRLFVVVAGSIALYEFYLMFWPGRTRMFTKGIALALGAGIMFYARPGPETMILIYALLGAACFYAAMSFLFDYGLGNEAARLEGHAVMPMGILYIPVALQLVLHFSLPEQILIIFAAMASDTGAYYAGSLLGRHKLWPRVSPKKSWEGAVGGLIACIAAVSLIGRLAPMPADLATVPLWLWVCLGLALHMASLLGDFFESAIKRVMNVKDSGGILPGHGGLLDRIDSMLFALPAYAIFRFFMV